MEEEARQEGKTMRYTPMISYDLVLLITEALAVLLAIWIIWMAQVPSVV